MKLFLLFIFVEYSTLAAAKCVNHNEIEVCNDDMTKCFCKTCLTCPPGYGLNKECGGQINIKDTLKCIHCDHGSTYSSKNNSGMCQPCPRCHGHKMLQSCTIVSATKCSPNECEKGYKWNSVVEACEPIPSPKPHSVTTSAAPTPTQDTEPTAANMTDSHPTESKGINKDTSATSDIHHNNSTMLVVILVVVLIIVIIAAVIGTILFVNKTKICQWYKRRSEQINTAEAANELMPLKEEPSPELTRQEKADQAPTITVQPQSKYSVTKGSNVTFSCKATGYPLPTIEWKKDKSLVSSNIRNEASGEETIVSYLNVTSASLNDVGSYICVAENEAGKAISKIADLTIAYPWPADLLLNDIRYDLRESFESKITCPEPPKKGWRPLGEELNIDKDALDKIQNHSQEERGRQLFVALSGEKPRLTLSAFVDALCKHKRLDIVEHVVQYYHSRKE